MYEMASSLIERDVMHVERFPVGLFTDELWQGLGAERLRIDKEKLQFSIRLVRDFCTWLDGKI
jgi:hypothetical protein